MPFVYIFFCS
uniref:Uncharacterized protein n=1 Tax=Anguilla anguilla TaxID=7936 RepID=A0A0E9PH13_ANGAN